MKLLVTGGLGFIGSNFILNTIKKDKNISITNVDAEFYGSNSANLCEIENYDNYNFVKGNITNYQLMEKLIADCDVVVNFAAESFVDRSIANPQPFIDSNIIGTFTILNIIKKQKKRLVHISTDEVYGSLSIESATENFRFNPSSPYSATKASAEHLVNSFVMTYDCDCVITRCSNNYGPRQFPEKLIPKAIILAQNNMKIPLYGRGNNIRDWLYVYDHCQAIYEVMLHGKQGESYNISANNEISNLEIINKILSIMGKRSDLIQFVEDRPSHDFRYSLDSTKIRNKLQWHPTTNFEDGIKKTIDWYIENSHWWKDLIATATSFTPWKN
jgi:dTDP-glucose 4,6-dehydratase